MRTAMTRRRTTKLISGLVLYVSIAGRNGMGTFGSSSCRVRACSCVLCVCYCHLAAFQCNCGGVYSKHNCQWVIYVGMSTFALSGG